jgi:hypothetical protein
LNGLRANREISNPNKILNLRRYYQIEMEMQQEFLEVQAEVNFRVTEVGKMIRLLSPIIISEAGFRTVSRKYKWGHINWVGA